MNYINIYIYNQIVITMKIFWLAKWDSMDLELTYDEKR